MCHKGLPHMHLNFGTTTVDTYSGWPVCIVTLSIASMIYTRTNNQHAKHCLHAVRNLTFLRTNTHIDISTHLSIQYKCFHALTECVWVCTNPNRHRTSYHNFSLRGLDRRVASLLILMHQYCIILCLHLFWLIEHCRVWHDFAIWITRVGLSAHSS